MTRFALEGSMSVLKIQDQLNALSTFDGKNCVLIFHSKASNSNILQLQVFQKCEVYIKTTCGLSGNYSLEMDFAVDVTVDSWSGKLPKKQKIK